MDQAMLREAFQDHLYKIRSAQMEHSEQQEDADQNVYPEALRSTANLRVRADLPQGIQLHYNIIGSLVVQNLNFQPIPMTSKFYCIAT